MNRFCVACMSLLTVHTLLCLVQDNNFFVASKGTSLFDTVWSQQTVIICPASVGDIFFFLNWLHLDIMPLVLKNVQYTSGVRHAENLSKLFFLFLVQLQHNTGYYGTSRHDFKGLFLQEAFNYEIWSYLNSKCSAKVRTVLSVSIEGFLCLCFCLSYSYCLEVGGALFEKGDVTYFWAPIRI